MNYFLRKGMLRRSYISDYEVRIGVWWVPFWKKMVPCEKWGTHARNKNSFSLINTAWRWLFAFGGGL